MNLALFDFDGTITTREMFSDFMQFAVTPRRLAVGKVVLARIGQAGERFSREVLPGVLRAQALQRIAWHKAQGDVVVVVSGALDMYLEHWCRQHRLELICSELEVVDGRLTGRYRGDQCVGTEKPRRVLEKYDLNDFSDVYAYGDTHEDLDLLGIASRRYFGWQEVA